MMVHVNITIRGRVQKIGYRFLSMQAAVKFGIHGFIMPLDKDKLYIEAEGPEEKIELFKEWCHKGPYPHNISQVSIEKGEMKNFTSYEILSRGK
ncbi:MAG: acylphosphatase [Bacteroidota bacterium]